MINFVSHHLEVCDLLFLQFTFYSHPRRSNHLGHAVHEFVTEHWIPDAANVGVGANEHCTIVYNIELHGGKIKPEDMTKIETHLFSEPAARAAREEAAFAGAVSSSSASAATRDTLAPTVARGRGRGGRTQTANGRTRRGDEPLQQSLVRNALTRHASSQR